MLAILLRDSIDAFMNRSFRNPHFADKDKKPVLLLAGDEGFSILLNGKFAKGR